MNFDGWLAKIFFLLNARDSKLNYTITSTYRFINIEASNKERDPEFVELMVEWLKELLWFSKKVLGPNSSILWYDSLIKDGLKWQNELNEKNLELFLASSGIFTNYTWQIPHLKRSHELAASFNRNFDVFVGVDIFGRGGELHPGKFQSFSVRF